MVGGGCKDERLISPKEVRMPGNVPPVADEREGLLAFLAQQRAILKVAAFGLTEDQTRAAPSASALNVGGLLSTAQPPSAAGSTWSKSAPPRWVRRGTATRSR